MFSEWLMEVPRRSRHGDQGAKKLELMLPPSLFFFSGQTWKSKSHEVTKCPNFDQERGGDISHEPSLNSYQESYIQHDVAAGRASPPWLPTTMKGAGWLEMESSVS